ncbi:MAG: Sugar transferase, partial [Candidatus Hydrogenedentes bacterium]|nr:Sugar transferase [Candidatus Hydrogenedentota bacterium]
MAADIAVCSASMGLAQYVRFHGAIPPPHIIPYLTYLPLLVAWRLLMAQAFGLYDFRHRLTGADHFFGALNAAIAGVAPGYLFLAFVRLYYAPETHLSRVVALLDLLLLAAWFTVSRLAVLTALARLGRKTRVLLIGALDSCRAMAHEIRAHGPKLIEVAGIATWKDEGGEALGRADEL